MAFNRIDSFIDITFKTRSGAKVNPAAESMLTAIWQQSLPPHIGKGARPAYLRGRSLVVFVPTASMASQIRQIQPVIIDSLKKNGLTEVTALSLKIDPGAAKTAPKATTKKALTASSRGSAKATGSVPAKVQRALAAMRRQLEK